MQPKRNEGTKRHESRVGWLDERVAVVRPVHEKAIEIIELSLKGLSNADIARQVGLNVRRVRLLKEQTYDCWTSDVRRRD